MPVMIQLEFDGHFRKTWRDTILLLLSERLASQYSLQRILWVLKYRIPQVKQVVYVQQRKYDSVALLGIALLFPPFEIYIVNERWLTGVFQDLQTSFLLMCGAVD